MQRIIVGLAKWELSDEEGSCENLMSVREIALYYETMEGGEYVKKSYPVLATSEHYIITDSFAIKRASWAENGEGEVGYLNFYEVLELLEKR